MKRIIAVLVVVLLVAAGIASAIEVYDIDDDHDLANEDAVQEYRGDGLVSTHMLAPDLKITLAAEHEDVGVDGFRADTPWHYLRLQYNETLPAEFRLYFPAGYWHPHPQDIEAVDGDVTAELRPIDNGEQSSVTVRFEGQSDVVFAIPRSASAVFATRDYGKDFVENRTNMTLPRLGSNDPWAYVDEGHLTGSNTTVAVQAKNERKLVVQYDAGDSFDERWIHVPACQSHTGKDEPVCQFTRDGEPDRVYVLSRVSNPPPIRYKYDPGATSQVQNIQDSIAVTLDRALAWIGGLFGVVSWV